MPRPLTARQDRPLRVAWISDFPVEWMPGVPEEAARLPRQHPATWQWVLLNELEKDATVDLHVVILRKDLSANRTFRHGGATFHLLKVPGGIRAPSLFWIDTILIRPALALIQPDLVHAWGTERGAALVASRLPYPYLVTIQGLLTWYSELVPLGRYDRFAAWLEQLSLPRARVITTESRFSVDYLRARYPRATVQQAEHAPAWRFHEIRRRPQISPMRILCVGTWGYRKGSDLLLRALDGVIGKLDFELIAVGGSDESFLAVLRSELSPSLWQRITVHRHLTPEQIADELSRATILALPTRADTSPNAVKEAVVAGVPVVATAVGGVPDYVFPGRNGVLSPAGDLAGVIHALQEAAAHPLFSRGQVDPTTLQEMRAYLSPAQMRTNFLKAYSTVMDQAETARQR
jgi:glycosyltransferase involved in cell wall biosynthesis